MRLIDADELVEDLKGSLFYSDAIPLVEDAPTAYDVDKAAEAVEQYFDNELEQWFKGTEPQELYEYKENVLKIVRKGGAE